MGFGLSGAIIVIPIIISEISYGSFVSLGFSYLFVAWSISEIIILPLTWITTDWYTFVLLFMTIPILSINILIRKTLCETPLYYMNKDK